MHLVPVQGILAHNGYPKETNRHLILPMNTAQDPLEFLELACLRYDGADSVERRAAARESLAKHPEWVNEHPAVAAATGALDPLRGHLAKDKSLVDQRYTSRGWTLLHGLCLCRAWVAKSDVLGCLDSLLEAGADPSAEYDLGGYCFRPLTAAIGHGERGIERLPPHPSAHGIATRLFRAGAPANDPQALYNTMLSPGNEWIELLLENGLRASDVINWDMGTPEPVRSLDFVLAHAAGQGDLGRMRLLLAHGADPNANDPYSGRTMVTAALLRGQIAAVELLGQAGATPDELTLAERFWLACLTGDRPEARRLHALEAQTVADPGDLLIELLSGGKRGMAALLIELGADPNARNKHGASALHHAAWQGDLGGIDLLLNAGANRELVDRVHKSTPGQWARVNNQIAAAERLG